MNDRQAWALSQAHQVGSVKNGDVRLKFGVSTESARKDLIGLCRDGLLHRQGANSGTRYVIGEQNARSRVVAKILDAPRAHLAAVEDLLRRLVSG